MRVLVVHNSYREPGGEDSVVAAEANLLAAAGHRVALHRVDNPTGAAASALGLTRSAWNHRQATQMKNVAERFDPDIVHVHNTWFALSPAILWSLRTHRAARVLTVHNYRLVCVNASLLRGGFRCTDCLGRSPWPGVVHRCYRGSAVASMAAAAAIGTHRALGTWSSQVERVIVPTELVRRLIAGSGVTPERISVKPHFTSDPGPRPAPPSASRTVLYAGRISPEKGLSALVAAWVADRPPGMELVLVGDGSQRREFAAAGPGVRVEPWVPRSRLIEMMLGARAVITPTPMFETFGLTAVEAMAAGTPVVTVAGGAADEVVGPDQPAPVDLSDLMTSWRRALTGLADDSSVDEWGRAARRRFEDRYTPDAGLRRLLEVYQQARGERLAG